MNKFDFEYKQINSKYIVSDPEYQRFLDLPRVKKIVANFNPNLVNPCKVSFRDGKYYVFDGQHTKSALVVKNNGKDLMIDCKVYYGMSREDESRLFAEQNGIARQVSSNQKLKSLYTAKDIDVIDFKETIEETGITCDFSKGTANNKIVCYKSVFDIYMKYGKSNIKDVLRTIIEIWGGEQSSLQKEIIIGMNSFMNTYKGEYSKSSLVKRLSRTSPLTIIRDGKAIVTGGNKRFAKVILSIYNMNTSSNRLDDKL